MKLAAFCVLSLLPLVGCGHTKTVSEPPAGEGTTSKESEGAQAPSPHPKKTPVVESPETLLNPGAEDEIRAKLAAGGYLDDSHSKSLASGVRKFQAAKDLPVTGVIDHETVRRLGLDPDKIFRRAEPKP